MLDLTIRRREFTEGCTIGNLAFGDLRCFTLEDRVRPRGVKIPGSTCIPAGRYRVLYTLSQRFGRPMPLLVDVPGWTGIRIHSGNCAADTSGCILVGLSRAPGWVGSSRTAYSRLEPLVEAALRRGDLWCNIIDEPEDPRLYAALTAAEPIDGDRR